MNQNKKDTKYKKVESEIQINNQFEAIFNHATEGILIANSNGEIKKTNPSCSALFGYEKNELLDKTIETLIPKRFAANHGKHRDKFNEKPKARSMGAGLSLFGLKKDGTEFPIEISLSPFKIEDTNFVIAFIIDITERKKAEVQEINYRIELEKAVEQRTLILKEAIIKLEKTKLELDKSLSREKELNSIKSKFISIASHEFRTPLATVMSSLSLVEKYIENKDVEKRLKHIERIKKSVRNLTDILNDILSVNKIEEGKVMAIPFEFELLEFMNEIVNELSPILKSGQAIVTNFDQLKKIHLIQDAKLFRHIILNLISNAIKFSKEDKEILIEILDKKENVEVWIKDQGIGIPDSDKPNLFTRFFRSSNVEQIQGTGLGLSIVAQYTSIIKGKISFESIENQGSTFKIAIPKTISK